MHDDRVGDLGDAGGALVIDVLGIEGWIVGGLAWFVVYARAPFSFESALAAVSERPANHGPHTVYRVLPPPLAVLFDWGDHRRVAKRA